MATRSNSRPNGNRDARITRIYEGTNEINRLIVPIRLLKSGGLSRADDETRPPSRGSALVAEQHALANIKALAVALLSESAAAYGDSLRAEQEILGYISDVVIDAYAIESAAARAEKLALRKSARSSCALDIVRVHTADAVDRVLHAAQQVTRALGPGRAAAVGPPLAHLREFPALDTVAARRRIAAVVVEAGRHPF